MADPWTFAIRKRKNENPDSRLKQGMQSVEGEIFHHPDVLSRILQFAGSSVMVRSTCKLFREAHTSTTTSVADVIFSSSLITWAMHEHKFPCRNARLACARHGKLDAFLATSRSRRRRSPTFIYDAGAVSEAVRNGQIGILACVIDAGYADKICQEAAREGRIDVLQWARANRCPWDQSTCAAAAEGGHIDALRWVRVRKCPWDARTCAAAAKGGHLIVLQWLRSNGCPWDTNTCVAAAKRGHLNVLRWAHSKRCPWDARTCAAAAKGGHLVVLRWARLSGCRWDANTWHEAARAIAYSDRHFEIFKWIHENECPSGNLNICDIAAEYGNIDVLQWAHGHGFPWHSKTCAVAAENGRFDLLQWAHVHGCPWDASTCSEAARRGDIGMLQWAHDNGCPWDADTCFNAADRNDLAMLQWARNNGCPWDARTMCGAGYHGNFEMIKWVHCRGCPTDNFDACGTAVRYNNLEMLQWARSNGFSWGECVIEEVLDRPREIWIHLDYWGWGFVNDSVRVSSAMFAWACANSCPRRR